MDVQQHHNGATFAERPNFDNCVVLKPWGHEFQVFDNGLTSVWMLRITPGNGTSVHCHTGKSALFLPLLGEVTCRRNGEIKELIWPASALAERYEMHSVWNRGEEDLYLIEVEKPSDKHDLFRLRDSYDRGQGYEGGSNIVREGLAQFEHFAIDKEQPHAKFRYYNFLLEAGHIHISDGLRYVLIDIGGRV